MSFNLVNFIFLSSLFEESEVFDIRSTAGYTVFAALSISPLKFLSVETFFFAQTPLNFRVSRLNVPSHRVWTIKRIHAHTQVRRKSDDKPVRPRGLKGVRVTSCQSPGLFEPLLFIGSISLFPVQSLPFSLSLSLSFPFSRLFRRFPTVFIFSHC